MSAPTAPSPGPRTDPAAGTARQERPWGPPAAAVALAVLLVSALVGGGDPHGSTPGVPSSGPLVGWGLLVTRLLSDAAGIAAVGLLLGAAVLLPNREGRLTGSGFSGVRLASLAGGVWAVSSLVEFALTTSDILGRPVADVLQPRVFRATMDQVPQARALVVQVLMAVVLAVAARFTFTAGRALALLALAVATLVPPLLTGHSAAAGQHMLAISSLVVHVVALALWVGGLGVLLWVWRRSPESRALQVAATRFSTLALWVAVAVGVSGIVNAAVRLATWPALLDTAYGGLVLFKAALFFALVAAGARHRAVTLPRFGSDRRAFVRLAAAELLVMAAAVGLAVALGRTPTPAPLDEGSDATVDLDVLRSVIGFDPPPRPAPMRFVTEFQIDGFFLTGVLTAGILYAIGLRMLHRRGDAWPVGRAVSWYVGLAVVLYSTCGGLGAYSHLLFSAHMVSHMLLSMVAPIFLVLAAPVTLALRTLPTGSGPTDLGARQALLGVLHSRPVAFFTHPLVAAGIFVGSLFGLYFTPVLDYLMNAHLGHSIMAAHFLLAGSLFFYVLVGIDPAPRRLPHLARIGVLFAVMPFHAFFSVAVMSTSTVLANDYYTVRLRDPYGVGILHDQHVGGGLGWALGEVPVVIVLVAIFVAWVRADEREAKRRDRASDRAVARGEDDELAAYNAWLRQMNERAGGR
ncbi:putative copper resistance protein D [Motilibacter peucedani]|uniref:Putative copper resistance protein D n=1 Tax=Motilibacter peucedani TaxID=598650 RepID=A0A420XNJ1_9ACTN|nr:cytochrome c oxidase assembly protein [Motilibacter peucedani]RKS73748.1 putative copper resistance protein D [Motilibacter peucedani]